MFQNREEFSNARQHLHLLQTKVEKMLTTLVLQLSLWSDDGDGGDDEQSTAEILQLSLDFRNLLDEHFKQVSSASLLERAVTQHPSLSPVVRDVEQWQAAILRDFDTLIADLQKTPISSATIERYRDTIRRLQSEVLAEEQQERHIMERGWT